MLPSTHDHDDTTTRPKHPPRSPRAEAAQPASKGNCFLTARCPFLVLYLQRVKIATISHPRQGPPQLRFRIQTSPPATTMSMAQTRPPQPRRPPRLDAPPRATYNLARPRQTPAREAPTRHGSPGGSRKPAPAVRQSPASALGPGQRRRKLAATRPNPPDDPGADPQGPQLLRTLRQARPRLHHRLPPNRATGHPPAGPRVEHGRSRRGPSRPRHHQLPRLRPRGLQGSSRL